MQLHEAARLGALLKPQGFGALYLRGNTCVWGAVADAMGILKGEAVCGITAISENWPAASLKANCPACGNMADYVTVAGVMGHLNDDHRWSRERIADWVETIENPVLDRVEECVGV